MRNSLRLLVISAFIFCSCDFKHSHLDSIPFKGIHKVTNLKVDTKGKGIYNFEFYDITCNSHESVTFTSPRNVRLHNEGVYRGCEGCSSYVNVMDKLINIGINEPSDTITIDFTNGKVYHKGLDTSSLPYILGNFKNQ